ncbi:hypothetical protein FOTG_19249 [Fusarium oxysporum f. sp. vasinfectum 25433]|uniref:Uncharacterized protein n=1 Tax=Fusarium oxysporum f. sp. vasinfectum 25433 TaxID=1089449 RepID=X0LUP8_FUSOX|nr:hypothetical protein FOTG_19249 [Fusarium oxysporum f. sp. vasinfectum 25433]
MLSEGSPPFLPLDWEEYVLYVQRRNKRIPEEMETGYSR